MTTMTTPAAAARPVGTGRPGFWRRYGAMWRRVPRELAAILGLFVLGTAAFSVAWGLFAGCIGLLPAFLVGVFVLAASLLGARGLGLAPLAILEWAGLPTIPRPVWRQGGGFFGWLRSTFASSHNWLALLYWLLPGFVVATVGFAVLSTWLAVVVGAGSPFAWSFGPGRGIAWAFEREHLMIGPLPLLVGLHALVAAVLLFALPFVARGLAWAHWGVARGLLGAFRSEALVQDLAAAQASRAAAVTAEDSAIRRLERDIHDGPQQRLIRLQMDLASAERRLAADPDGARELIASASEQAKEALEELRAVSRGIAPPILLDRGLVAALESAATRSVVPAAVVAELPAGLVLRPELERNAYFIASEAMTNAVKHAAATHVGVRVALDEDGWLLVEVSDDGHGGATSVPAHGLAGLEDRARGLGGVLSVTSPDGGPTVVSARLPIRGE